ncbi:MAG: biotin--[acetyl-CoA-carboxylase] ligase [Mariprofundaceae bacterium]|nr:biotin--[acetyl-CoA-carboxylase] ligase [Mariprofundaceae bacterium]
MTNPKLSLASHLEAAIQPLKHIQILQHFDTIDSTNREAMRQLEAGVESGQVLITDQQSAGRGRLGRVWHSMQDSLAMSIILRPDIAVEHAPQLSLVTAVAIHQALIPNVPDIRLKWPNDLLIHGAKIAGILTEMRTKSKHVDGIVIGIGVNIKKPLEGWPDDIQQQATDLQSHAISTVSPSSCAMRILQSLDQWYETYLQQGFAPIRKAWWQAHIASQQKVRVFNGKAYITGIATDLDHDGALLLDVHGDIQRITAGEVFLSD